LRLNEDLTEAAALGHDIGHTPFGHAGEFAMQKCYDPSFTHYGQSVRVVEKLENDGEGLNLTWEVRDGIANHTGKNMASTLEGVIVKFADRIAYINHDIDDAIRAGVISGADIPQEIAENLGKTKSERITCLVNSIVNNSGKDILMDSSTEKYYTLLHEFLFEAVYKNPVAKSEEAKVLGIVEGLFDYYLKNPEKLTDEYKMVLDKEGIERAVADYIAGMTDHYATSVYSNIFIPKAWTI
jgi:dGTPase